MILYQVIRKPLSFLMNLSNDSVIAVYNRVNGVTDGAIDKIDQIKLIDQINNYVSGFSYEVPDTLFQAQGLDSLAAIPNFNLFGTSLAATPSFVPFTWLVIIPFLAAGLQWFSMFITRKLQGNAGQIAQDPNMQQTQMSMRMMDLVIPLMTVWMAFSFSAMMGLYWIFQSILGLIQTLILSKVMPIPKYTEEEIKELRKAQRAAEKQQKAIIKTQPKYKSLHYIDEDDYEELPEVKRDDKKPTKSVNNDSKPEIKD